MPIPTDEKLLHQGRISVSFFCVPNKDAVLETLDGSGKYPAITTFEYLGNKIKSISVTEA